jgi:hypothetical protein
VKEIIIERKVTRFDKPNADDTVIYTLELSFFLHQCEHYHIKKAGTFHANQKMPHPLVVLS